MQYFYEISALCIIFILEHYFAYHRALKDRNYHASVNLTLYFINSCVAYFLFATVLIYEAGWMDKHSVGILNWWPLPAWANFILAFILFDLWMYLVHRIMHAVPWFWRFHRVHHSDSFVDVTTATRHHVGEQLIIIVAGGVVIPLIGLSAAQLGAYSIYLSIVSMFYHSNLNVPEKWDRVIRWVIVTPRMHRVHHYPELPDTDSNYGSFFSFWDRLGGTYRNLDHSKGVRYGLEPFNTDSWQSLAGALKTPFGPK